MAISTKSSPQNTGRRVWHTPTSKAALYWCLFALLFCALFYLLYLVLFKAPIFTGPWFDRIFRAGVFSYLMILAVSAYSLRTRFMRSLPWKSQNWVWMHMWLGIAAVLLALLHADFRFVLHGYCANLNCVTDHYWGMPALYGLIFIAVSGAVGRLLDKWQARSIAQDASTNGVGISKAIKDRLLELEYVVERFSAGKSEPFKQYCAAAIESVGALPGNVPTLSAKEQTDFQRAYTTLEEHARLEASLKKQHQAHIVFRSWRYAHMVLVPLALLIISYHGIAELLINVLHILPRG
ncbi:MAG TPA: hypothetical protein DCL75_17100 [Ktedonobacter sp.]|nr:hypothetical protein [Ktedonobacter sp.]HAH00522.1 hypothetical protein [Ktedonobacter sp.]